MISVVIVTFKSSSVVDKCLKTIDKNVEIIVIENSSDINFKKKLESNYSNLQCILTGSNLGYGAANNIGINLASNDYVLILNPDTTIEKDTIQNLITVINSGIDFSILAPLIKNLDADTNYKNYGFFYHERKQSDTSKNLIDVDFVKGFAMLLNKKKFDKNYFDENIFLYLEEIDLCKRMIEKQQKIFVVLDSKVTHYGSKSHDNKYEYEMEMSKHWHWMWSKFYYDKKHKGYFKALIFSFKNILFLPLKILYLFLTFNFKKSNIYLHRLMGLYYSIIGKKSSYRPKI